MDAATRRSHRHAAGEMMERIAGPKWHLAKCGQAVHAETCEALAKAHAHAPLKGAGLAHATQILQGGARKSLVSKIAGVISSRLDYLKKNPSRWQAPIYPEHFIILNRAIGSMPDRILKYRNEPHISQKRMRENERIRRYLGGGMAPDFPGGVAAPSIAMPRGSQAALETLRTHADPEDYGVILYNYGGKNMGLGANSQGGGMPKKARFG
jgi:hypothetical protein